MPKLPLAAIAATLYATTALAIPDFAPTASSAWYSYTREWMPPSAGACQTIEALLKPDWGRASA